MAGRPITEQHDTEDADTYPMLSEGFVIYMKYRFTLLSLLVVT